MWICPPLALKTLRGTSRLVSLSQVVRPVRSLPLNSLTTPSGRTALGSALGSEAPSPTSSAAQRNGRIIRHPSREGPHLHETGHVGRHEPSAIGGKRHGVNPVLELPAA